MLHLKRQCYYLRRNVRRCCLKDKGIETGRGVASLISEDKSPAAVSAIYVAIDKGRLTMP